MVCVSLHPFVTSQSNIKCSDSVWPVSTDNTRFNHTVMVIQAYQWAHPHSSHSGIPFQWSLSLFGRKHRSPCWRSFLESGMRHLGQKVSVFFPGNRLINVRLGGHST